MRVRERVGSGRGRAIERKSRGWKRREGGWECVCKRDRVGDGRECESVRESRWWHRELVRDGRQRERE